METSGASYCWQLAVPFHTADADRTWYFIDVGVLYLTTLGRSWLASMIVWFWIGVLDYVWKHHEFSYVCSYINQDVGEPTGSVLSATGMYAGKSIRPMGYVGYLLLITCGNHYVVVKRNWVQRGFLCSESVVLFHLVSWMSFLWGWFVFVCVFWGLFVLLFEDIRLFAFHLFSYKLRIVDRLHNVDDRQSLERARHGLKWSWWSYVDEIPVRAINLVLCQKNRHHGTIAPGQIKCDWRHSLRCCHVTKFLIKPSLFEWLCTLLVKATLDIRRCIRRCTGWLRVQAFSHAAALVC